MLSVMAIRSEVFGSCVEGIDVSVEIGNRVAWLCCESNYLGFFWQAKRLNVCSVVGRWCQVLEGVLTMWVLIEEIKNPCGSRGLLEL
jgi:hypothetical protein